MPQRRAKAHPNRIREIRENAGYKRSEFARRLEVSSKHIFTIEQGAQDPSLALALKMRSLLKCTLDDLYPADGTFQPRASLAQAS